MIHIKVDAKGKCVCIVCQETRKTREKFNGIYYCENKESACGLKKNQQTSPRNTTYVRVYVRVRSV